MTSFTIDGRPIGPAHPPLIIAEMSGNHNQSLDRALALVDAAARAGAHALKLQTYTADTMTLDLDEREFHLDDPQSLWRGNSLYALYQKAHTPWEWHEALFKRCRERGMIAFSTPFDATAVDFLERLQTPAYKIASFENCDLALIQKVASTKKPLILSTGLATLQELEDAVAAARDAGCRELLLLKCTSAYPASPADSHLRTLADLAGRFDCLVGLSDHTPGIGAAVASIALGSVAIEKHFTLKRSDGGVDADFSLEEPELRSLVEETHRAWQALGSVHYGPTPAEKPSLVFRRSLYVVRDIAPGELFTESHVRAIRPGYGLAPKFRKDVIGRKAARAVPRGTALDWTMVTR